VRVIQLFLAVLVEPAPPGPEATRTVPERKIGIEDDAVYTVIAPVEKVRVALAEPRSHGKRVGFAYPCLKLGLPRQGPPIPSQVSESA